jgi:uncharacterized repeat protein (TIGR01451 family)
LVKPGDTLAYTVTLRNIGVQTLFDVMLTDMLPANTSYVAGSTTLNGAVVPDNSLPATAYPLDEGGLQIGPILVGSSGVVSFRVIANSFPPIYASVANTAIAVSDAGVLTATVSIAVNTGNATACGLDFVNAGGAGVSFYVENGVAYVQVSDNDKNTNAGAVETVTALVQDQTTTDYETIILTETGANTGIFRGSLPTSITAGQAVEDGTLYARGGETLLASYRDAAYGDVCSDSAIITLPSQTKTLYLSEPGQSLDRVDPVATGDSTTSLSEEVGVAVAESIAFDNSASAIQACSSGTVAYDNASSAQSQSNNPITFAHTTGTGSNRLLVVGFVMKDPKTVTSITYNGVALTKAGAIANTSNVEVQIWYLVNPASGANNVVVNWAGGTVSHVGAATFTGVHQTAPLGTFVSNKNTGADTTPNVTVSSSTGDLVFDVMGARNPLLDSTVGAGQTARWNLNAGGNALVSGGSTEPGGGSVNMGWTLSTPGLWAIGAVPIKPAAACPTGVTISNFTTGAGSNRLLLVGVSIDLNSPTAAISSISYGAQSLTKVGDVTNGSNERAEIWRLLNPPAGTANITVTMNGQAHNGLVAGAATFSGVNQSTPLGTVVTNTGASTTPTVTVSSASDEQVFAAVAAGQGVIFSAVGAGQTSRWNATDTADIAGAASTKTGAASVTMSWTSSNVPWAIAGVSLKPAPGAITTTGMAVWYSGSGSATRYNPWNGSAFTGAANTASLGTINQGLQGAAAPTRDEKVVIGIDASGVLKGEVWNGSAWTLIPSGSLGSPGFSHQWAYDAAYEQSSGDALIAFADGASDLKYATWNGSSWSSATTVSDYAALSGGNTPKKVTLAARPGSNELVMVVTENLGKTMAWIWNGSSWGSGAVLYSATGGPNTSSAVAYESLSGNIMATYSKGFGQTAVYYKIWNGSAWSAESSTAAPAGITTNFNFSSLASDPTSDRIVLGVTTASGTAKTWMNVWDGNAWGASVIGSATAGSVSYPSVDVAFESTSGEALAVFNVDTSPYVYYKFWKPATGWLAVQGLGAAIGAEANLITLSPDPNSNRIMVLAQNISDDLYYTFWPGGNPMSPDPAILMETSTGGSAANSQPFLFLWDEHLSGSGGGGVTSTGFTQFQPMASDLVMPAGGQITITTYVSTTGALAANPAITATLKANGVTFATLTGPTATNLGSGKYRLAWSAVLGVDVTVATGQAVNLTVSSGVTQTFQILYDSATYPSKVELPTTTVIELDELGVFDAAYPYGSAVINPYPGQTVYVRVTASDPFGAADIISATLNVSGTLVTLDDSYVVASTAASKTYEYAWQTPAHDGACPVAATAHEGYEGIADSASLPLTCRSHDTGTPSVTEFTTGSNGLHTTRYATDEQVCVRTTDADQNQDGGVVETIVDTIVSVGGGDSEVVTLTETGADTGVFVACIPASSSGGGTHNNGTLYAPSGDTLNVTYVDPNDPSDTSSDVAQVAIAGASGPGIAVFKWLAAPPDGVAVVGELVRFDLTVINSGDANLVTVILTDTFASGCLAYTSASLAPSSVSGSQLVWNNLGPRAAGDYLDLSVYFTASAACNPATNQATVSGVTGSGAVVTDGPVLANVIITNPGVTVEKVLLTAGTALAGEPVSFRITVTNSGSTALASLPLLDSYSNYCLAYVSASPGADGAGGGVAVWNDLGGLGVGASTSVVVNFRAAGPCDPALNTAIVSGAVDVNGDTVPAAWDDASVVTTVLAPAAALTKTLAAPATGWAYLGDVVTFTVRITNTGPNVLTQIVLTDTWASSCMTLTAWGAYTPTALSTGQATWNTLTPPAPPVWPGEGLTLTLGFRTTAAALTCTNTVTLTGVDQFEQAFGPLSSQASVRVLPAAATVYGHIFEDRDGNGSQNGLEPPLANISVVITDSVGLTRTLTTDASGAYTATVPAGNTTADIVEATLPAGYVQTAGSDPSSVNVPAGSVTDIGADGYRPLPVAVGDRVCVDFNSNDLCEDTDAGVARVPLRVTGEDIFGATVDITVTTSITGYYLVGGLTPGVYTVTAPGPTYTGFLLSSPSLRSAALPTGGMQDLTLDFIYVLPTAVQVSAPQVVVRPGAVRLSWEARLYGRAAPAFHVWRAVTPGGGWKRLTAAPLGPATNDGETAAFVFSDAAVERGVTYAYRLEAEDGAVFGPWSVAVPATDAGRAFLPLVGR